MYKTPPLIKTDKTPDDIAGHGMGILESHYKATYQVDPDKFLAAERAFMKAFKLPDYQLNRIADLYREIREHGYVFDGIGEHGSIKFGVNLMSEVSHMLDTKYPLQSFYEKEEIDKMRMNPVEFTRNIGINHTENE